LILSRNLTDDRSWDLNLCLEGKPKGGVHKVNREIVSFVQGLSGWTAKKLGGLRQKDIESLAKDLHRCDWDLPGAFEQVAFHVMGVGQKPRPFRIDASDEVVIISPFVSDGAIQAVAASARTAVALVSRSEELALLTDETRLLFQRVDVLNDDADSESEEEFIKDSCRGLHAKAIVLRRGWWTHLFVGSANCTNAAMTAGKNVEVMAELVGRQSKVGSPSDWISEKGLGPLLLPYSPVDPQAILKQKAVEDALERCRQFLIKADLKLECRRDENGYRLLLSGVEALQNLAADVWVWPLTVPADRQIAVGKPGASGCDLGVYAAQDITSLTGFRMRLNGVELSFGLELPLTNPPADREAGVLALILRNRAGFMRYLSLLLGEGEDLLTLAAGNEDGPGWFGGNGSADDSPPLFELLVKAFSRHPDKLDYVASAVDRLRKAETDSGEQLIPPEFLQMWRTFEEARSLGASR
jgi:hypothetical protein